jgi:TatD DNase family protein
MMTPPTPETDPSSLPLRILLETDAPYMVPANLYDDLPAIKGKKLPVCHSAMVPWTAQFVADVANGGAGGAGAGPTEGRWTADGVMRVARENARKVYGV